MFANIYVCLLFIYCMLLPFLLLSIFLRLCVFYVSVSLCLSIDAPQTSFFGLYNNSLLLSCLFLLFLSVSVRMCSFSLSVSLQKQSNEGVVTNCLLDGNALVYKQTSITDTHWLWAMHAVTMYAKSVAKKDSRFRKWIHTRAEALLLQSSSKSFDKHSRKKSITLQKPSGC